MAMEDLKRDLGLVGAVGLAAISFSTNTSLANEATSTIVDLKNPEPVEFKMPSSTGPLVTVKMGTNNWQHVASAEELQGYASTENPNILRRIPSSVAETKSTNGNQHSIQIVRYASDGTSNVVGVASQFVVQQVEEPQHQKISALLHESSVDTGAHVLESIPRASAREWPHSSARYAGVGFAVGGGISVPAIPKSDPTIQLEKEVGQRNVGEQTDNLVSRIPLTPVAIAGGLATCAALLCAYGVRESRNLKLEAVNRTNWDLNDKVSLINSLNSPSLLPVPANEIQSSASAISHLELITIAEAGNKVAELSQLQRGLQKNLAEINLQRELIEKIVGPKPGLINSCIKGDLKDYRAWTDALNAGVEIGKEITGLEQKKVAVIEAVKAGLYKSLEASSDTFKGWVKHSAGLKEVLHTLESYFENLMDAEASRSSSRSLGAAGLLSKNPDLQLMWVASRRNTRHFMQMANENLGTFTELMREYENTFGNADENLRLPHLPREPHTMNLRDLGHLLRERLAGVQNAQTRFAAEAITVCRNLGSSLAG